MAVYEFPASFGQRRLWLLDAMDPGEPAYNISWALWLDGVLDLDALKRAWNALLDRHEALRTTFRNESGLPVQVIDDEAVTPPLPVTSLEDLAADQREPAARAAILDLARGSFDLTTGPLVRAMLIRLAPRSHVLALVVHHIVADGWSCRTLFDELSADYEAIIAGGDPVVEEPPIQYADFALWQLEQAEEGAFAPAERFWRDALSGAPATLPLPVDQPYPPRQTFTAGGIDAEIEPALAAGLQQLAARLDTTRFTTLLTAYAVVLSRLTGRDDLLLSVPMAARTRPEAESVVGLFMNTVIIRVQIDRAATLRELVRSVHAAATRALAHQELPTARVVELVNPDRDPARMTLGQVMFAMEESWAVPDRGGLRWRPELIQNGTTKFEIELTVTDAATGPRVRVNYNSDLFHPDTGQLVCGGFLAVLRRLVTDPEQLVGDADIMSPEDAARVTREWPTGGLAAGPEMTAVELLRAACTGDRVLAADANQELTGQDVQEQARRITAAIRAQGVGVSDRVAILMPRGARLVPTILGIWNAGASYVPMDPIYPAQRLAVMLADSGARAMVVDSGSPGAPGLPPGAPPIPVVDLATLTSAADSGAADASVSEASVTGALTKPVADLPPSATAVTIFTSGSTGRPKAVSVTHGGNAALLAGMSPLLALGPDDRFVAVSTLAFDIALVELLAPVLAGGCVVVADAEHTRDPARLRDLLTESKATAMQATPSGWRMLVDAGEIPAGVRLRMTVGEPLPRDLADVIAAGPDTRFWNMYGPTETTIYSGGELVALSPAPLEIGSIIPGNWLYILDDQLRPVPPGVFGEVCIGGAGVATGYHGLPALTAKQFVPDPFSERPGARMYRTGDIGRWRRTGRIELAGRADRQLKIRGYRVESGEVEVVLRRQEDIAQAVVSARGAGDDVRLVAYLVTRSGTGQPPPGLRERLREVLPDYMVPAAFVVLPALPISVSGKIDYHALPEPDWGAASGPAPVAPRTPVESQLAAMVAELLMLPSTVGVSDNFFALGGHSLTATRLIARIRDAYGVDLPVRTLFADPTVAGLASALAARTGNSPR